MNNELIFYYQGEENDEGITMIKNIESDDMMQGENASPIVNSRLGAHSPFSQKKRLRFKTVKIVLVT